MHGYTLDIKESVRHDRSLSHRIIRSFFVLRFHRISFEFFFFFSFSFSNPVYGPKYPFRPWLQDFSNMKQNRSWDHRLKYSFFESRIRRRLERRSDACGKFEEIKVFFFLIPSISSTRINGIYECDYQGWLYSIPFCFHFNNVCQIMDVYLAHNYSNYRLKIFFYLPDTRYLPNNYFTYPLWTQIVHDLIAYSWNNTVIIKLYV